MKPVLGVPLQRLLVFSWLAVSMACGNALFTPDAGLTVDGGSSAPPAGGNLNSSFDAGEGSDAGSSADAGSQFPPEPTGPLSLDGHFEATLKRTNNSLTLQLRDAQSLPWTGAAVSVELWMPAHGHGAPSPAVVDQGDGSYRAADVDFTMAGTWEVTGSATLGALTTSQTLTVVVP